MKTRWRRKQDVVLRQEYKAGLSYELKARRDQHSSGIRGFGERTQATHFGVA